MILASSSGFGGASTTRAPGPLGVVRTATFILFPPPPAPPACNNLLQFLIRTVILLFQGEFRVGFAPGLTVDGSGEKEPMADLYSAAEGLPLRLSPSDPRRHDAENKIIVPLAFYEASLACPPLLASNDPCLRLNRLLSVHDFTKLPTSKWELY
jgi:hypothetical protein